MTKDEMDSFTSTLADEPRLASVVPAYVEMAKQEVVNFLFPFEEGATWDDVPERHHVATCIIACYLVNRRGAEGETAHSENGVSHTYESAGIPASFFAGMTPKAGIPR